MRDLGLGISTPLGRLALRVTCGAASTDAPADRRDISGSGVTRWHWEDVSGLRVDALVTPYATSAPQLPVDAAVGCLLTWWAHIDSPEVLLEAALPVVGHAASGERLEALEFETPEWLLAVGGPDDDLLGQQVEAGHLPSSWRGLLVPDCWDTDFGAIQREPGTLAWRLPGLLAGERARHHVAVAWRVNDGEKELAVGPWFAVDTTAEALRSATASEA